MMSEDGTWIPYGHGDGWAEKAALDLIDALRSEIVDGLDRRGMAWCMTERRWVPAGQTCERCGGDLSSDGVAMVADALRLTYVGVQR